jgi:hypothetical protein
VYTDQPDQVAADQVAIPLDAPIVAPDRPILDLDDATIEQVGASYIPMEEARGLPIGNVQAVIPGGIYLYPWHQFALTMLQQSIGSRPIYFASSGNAASELGVQPFLVRHGLAFKLVNGDPQASEGAVAIDNTPIKQLTGAVVDVPRTDTLLERVFVQHSGIPEWDRWPDHSTIGIPNYYAWAYYGLAQAAAQAGDQERMERFQALADRWSILGAS